MSLPAPGCSLVQIERGRAWSSLDVALPFDAVTALYEAGGKWLVLPVLYGTKTAEPWVDPVRVRRKSLFRWEPMRYADADAAMSCERAITAAVEAMPDVFAEAMTMVNEGDSNGG